MKTLSKFAAVILAAVTVLSLVTACGSSSAGSEVDVSALADELNNDTVTTDTLTETGSDMLASIYFFKDGQVVSSKAYMSSGATADEICVVECNSASDASEAEKLFQTRADSQEKLYETYNAAESDKLKNALIKSSGKYAVFVVCDDYSKAGDILKKYGF